MKIILASNNKSKLHEFSEILNPMGYEVITQAEAGADIEAEENGSTFEENAYIKAKAAYDLVKLPVIADDSGLEVDALNGEPGIYSARYSENNMHCEKVLEKMKEEKVHMVIVSDEYGGTMGILTMEDVLEQIVGEIWDESDEVEVEITEISDTEYDISGDMRIFDFFDFFDLEDAEFEDDNATVGGWITDMLEGEIEEGASFTFENLQIKVTETSSRRVDRLHVLVGEIAEEEEDLF